MKALARLLTLFALVFFATTPLYAEGIWSAFPTATPPVLDAWTSPTDTHTAGGLPPQTVNLTMLQYKDYVFGGYTNSGIVAATATGATTASVATCNGGRCRVTSAALTTAAAAINTLTLTNAAITANSQILWSIAQGTNTTADVTPMTATPSAGSALITFKNNNAGALNGTIIWNVTVVN